MSETQVVFTYHTRTKHHFQRFAASLGYLDWATQPDPFRRYEGAPLLPLLHSGEIIDATYDDLFRPDAISPQPLNLASISALFEFSLALSAWKEYQGSRWALRINPSSGNLHPTEGYLVAPPIDGLHDRAAVYHYAPKEHALERRCDLSAEAASVLPAGTVLVALTSIHWREAWKYGERAFRYCQHDAGHALAAVSFAAAMLGWTARMIDIDDDGIAALLGLNRDEDFAEAEREEPDLLLLISSHPCDVAVSHHGTGESAMANHEKTPLHPPLPRGERGGFLPSTNVGAALGQSCNGIWHGRANALSRDHVDWPIIDGVTQAAKRTLADPIPSSVVETPAPYLPLRPPTPARTIIRRRRSAVAFDGQTSISAEAFYLMLDRTLPRFDRPPFAALGPPACVHLALFVHQVEGLPKGLYLFVRDTKKSDELRAAFDPQSAWTKPEGCPVDLPLFLLKSGDARRVAAQLSCGQEIAGLSAFSLGMIAEFDRPIREYGPWFYRRLFWETGAIGQVLYLEAEAAGVRGTGIGCYFDDPVHELLGIKDNRFQSLYHFTVGGPVEDVRLTTAPPYATR